MKKIISLGTILSLIFLTSISFGQGFSKVWDGGLGGAGTDPPNLVRAWGVLAGFDLDNDGHKEFTSYDGTLKRIHVWESNQYGDNVYNLVWYMDKEVAGASILNGGERSIMITDLDEDGNLELVMVWDAYHPDSTNGFDALEIYEHEPGSGEFLPEEPTLSYDPPRNSDGLIRLEFQSQALDVDNDGTVELILTHRGGKNLLLSIISMPGEDFTNPGWIVEYVDTTRTGMKMHSMTVGDIDGNGFNDMLIGVDGFKKPIVVYSVTDVDSYTATEFDSSVYHPDYTGTQAKMAIADFNGDGNNEVYIGARSGGKVWVVNDITDAATAFRRDNFYLIEDINLLESLPPGKPNELRGGITGDADNDGLPDLYITARDPSCEAIYDFEWVGGPGGDVTDPDNYVMNVIFREDITDEINMGIVAIAIADIDGDGADHQDVVFTVGKDNEYVKPGIFMIEFDSTSAVVGVEELSTFTPGSYVLRQNYPNPFNPTTEILYELPRASRVTLDIYNVRGQKLNTLVKDKLQGVGTYRVSWDATDNRGAKVSSGVYFYKMEAGEFKATRKMVFLR